eukprot:TRINITY_DN2822_c0_g1_i1.p1 TRINITY_DN2822_c0_g1~~TRINITY_DN2822_c0_g1_i1.p1  ORF type:complete len:484 (-),score=115.37 TRINITY_DN2822_c0_g1_i1:157-1608(-)
MACSNIENCVHSFGFRTCVGTPSYGSGCKRVKASRISCVSLDPNRKCQALGAIHIGWSGNWQKHLILHSNICQHEKMVYSCHATQVRKCQIEKCCSEHEESRSNSSLQGEGYYESSRESQSEVENEAAKSDPCYQRNRKCCLLTVSSENYHGLAKAASYACNDAKFMNERARNDITLLSREITRWDARARQDFAILGSEFLKLDARAREDTEKIDNGVKKKAASLQRIAEGLTDKAQITLKTAAAEHWSDGALEADLRQADTRARSRATKDALMALEFVKNIHATMVKSMYEMSKAPKLKSDRGLVEGLSVEKEGKPRKIYPGKISDEQIAAIQSAYWSMASALSEADGIDYTNPDELEVLVATLLDMDAIDGKRSVSILVECSNSPDVGTRQALANALADAPSMWTLGNVGMGALQRLSQDSNPAVAAAASKAIEELNTQWQIEEGDTLIFSMDENPEGSKILDSDTELDDNDDDDNTLKNT